MPAVCTAEHLAKAGRLRTLLAAYAESEDLIRVGAYQKGGDPILDQAVAVRPEITAFLQQKKNDKTVIETAIKSLMALPG